LVGILYSRMDQVFKGASVGVVRGAESADTVVDAFTATAVAALAAIGIAGGGATTVDGNPEWRPSLWWTVFYFSGMVLIAWLA
jgi:hypothetical protein